MTRHMSVYDTKEWLKAVKNKGYKTFTTKELNTIGMNDSRYIKKAASLGLIKSIGMEKSITSDSLTINKWEIDETKLNMKRLG